MSDLPPDEMNKAQRLVLAGAVAPSLRGASEKTKNRRVGRVDAEGRVVGYTTLGEVQKALLLERQIELEPADGVRPKEVVCTNCGRTILIHTSGTIPRVCPRGCDLRCATDDCQNTVTVSTARAAARLGKGRGKCVHCACQPTDEHRRKLKEAWSKKPASERSEVARKRQEALGPERRSEIARKRLAGLSEEQKNFIAERVRAATVERFANLSTEERSALSKGDSTAEERSARARRAALSRSPEERAEAGRRGAARRWAKK